MDALSVDTGRLRRLLAEIEEKKLGYRVCAACDISGPGGGIYITAHTALTNKHLDWLERRNPSAHTPAYVDIVFARGESAPGAGAPAEFELPEPGSDEQERRRRAGRVAGKVAEQGKAVAQRAEKIYRAVGRMDFSQADLRRDDVEAGIREFERQFRHFHAAVKKAVDEYAAGNILVMDLILRHKLDKDTVRHALAVATFATEMAAQLALQGREEEEHWENYFGALSDAELARQLEGVGLEEEAQGREEQFHELFKRELVEIFLGGFMHDCGLWIKPFFLDEGHELKGARLIAETREVERFAPALQKIVLFHSDIVRLAEKYGVVEITEAPEDPQKTTYKREFYKSIKDARAAIELRHGNFRATVLNDVELRKILPVALAEYCITQTQDLQPRARWEVIGELTNHVHDGLYLRYMVVLCNSEVEVIAPRRSYVRLSGYISVAVPGEKHRRVQRLDVRGFEAGSIYHGGDNHSPHLITLFFRRADGGREKAEYLEAQDNALWERAAGPKSRMYLAAGRLRNNLSFRVTGFMSAEVYGKVLGEYEQEFRRRFLT